MEARIKVLEEQVKSLQTLQEIEEIKKLQRAYGYYLEYWMFQEIIDCFSDGPDVALEFHPGGTYLGKEGVIRHFEFYKVPNPEFLHKMMQLSPYIEIAEDGMTAKGRWFGYGPLAFPAGDYINQSVHSGTYENEYVKENGEWKIKVLRFYNSCVSAPAEGFIRKERVAPYDPDFRPDGPVPDIPEGPYIGYPTGYIFPFHFKHPVTGKETSEGIRNASLKDQDKK